MAVSKKAQSRIKEYDAIHIQTFFGFAVLITVSAVKQKQLLILSIAFSRKISGR